jgi:hypothetical protein
MADVDSRLSTECYHLPFTKITSQILNIRLVCGLYYLLYRQAIANMCLLKGMPSTVQFTRKSLTTSSPQLSVQPSVHKTMRIVVY